MTDWYSALPDTLTIDQNGAQVPLRDHPFVKETPDLPTFAKRAFEAHREVGNRIPLNVEKPEDITKWRQDHLPKLQKAGLVATPAADATAYFKKPESLPPGMTWNDNFAKSVGETLHKHGASSALGPELLGIWVKAQQEEQTNIVNGMKGELDEVVKGLKTEFADKYDERLESARRLARVTMKDATAMEFDPDLLPVFMRLGPLAESDSSFVRDVRRPGADVTGAAAWAEHNDIVQNKNNPKYKLYWDGDKATVDYVNGLATKAHPGERSI
jgi:hypothetical protein